MIPLCSTSLRVLLTAAILALAAAPARADGSVGVIVTGESTMQPQLVAQLETWLRAHGHELVSAPLPPDAISALIDCFVIEDQSCASRVVEKRAKSKVIVFAQATVTAGGTADRAVDLTAYWFAKGKDPVTEHRTCERCTDVTMRRTADELMESLVGGVATRVKVTSSPPGARVRLDKGKKEIGTTPFRYNFPLGAHRLVFELPDRAPETREVTMAKGEPTEIDVKFAPVPPGPSRWPGYAFLAGAVALGAAGGVLLAIDEDEPPPDNMTTPTYFNSAPEGVALVAGGAVALGVGVYFLVRSPSKKAAPTAAFVPGGGVIGWAGRF
jgi:hypothetical protein